ncbi:MAG TPA: trypsin-like peptidase domain-containing protein [Candidatus Caenarcaniphilales bacterium]|nr:trypsin-like peptidase domain-containing protein [Candidatus Caenarcaniphilales bacterium]
MTSASEVEQTIRSIADRIGPSVVRVGGGWRGGSGFVTEPGFVLTNAHNVHRESVPLAFVDGRQAEGRLAGLDVDGDLAVVAVETGDAAPVEWAEVSDVGIGTLVLSVAPSSSGPRITIGYVSSVAASFRGPRGTRITGGIEHTAPLAPGSSGSPLVDSRGRLIGINTNRLGGGFYLALPAYETLRQRAAALRRGERPERPRLGIGLAPAAAARRLRRAVGLPERDGLLVRVVEANSTAERAGIEDGDLIVEAGGRPLHDADDLYEVLGGVPAGGSLTLRVVRGAEERTVEVAFGEGPSAEEGRVH